MPITINKKNTKNNNLKNILVSILDQLEDLNLKMIGNISVTMHSKRYLKHFWTNFQNNTNFQRKEKNKEKMMMKKIRSLVNLHKFQQEILFFLI